MDERQQTFNQFWVFYLNEHQNKISKILHFIGTSSFLSFQIWGILLEPVAYTVALMGFSLIAWHGFSLGEATQGRWLHVLAMMVGPLWVLPFVFLPSMISAYACAWLGHFVFEKNRPATFHYPLWSFISDLKLFGKMAAKRSVSV